MASLKGASFDHDHDHEHDHSSEEESDQAVEQSPTGLARVYSYWNRFSTHIWNGFAWTKAGVWLFTTGMLIFWLPLWRAMTIADSMGAEMQQQPPF